MSWSLIIGVTIGVVIGVFLAIVAVLCISFHKRRQQIGRSSSRRASMIPIRANGFDNCSEVSGSTNRPDSPRVADEERGSSLFLEGPKRKNAVSVSGIPKYSHKYDQQFHLFLLYYISQLCVY